MKKIRTAKETQQEEDSLLIDICNKLSGHNHEVCLVVLSAAVIETFSQVRKSLSKEKTIDYWHRFEKAVHDAVVYDKYPGGRDAEL